MTTLQEIMWSDDLKTYGSLKGTRHQSEFYYSSEYNFWYIKDCADQIFKIEWLEDTKEYFLIKKLMFKENVKRHPIWCFKVIDYVYESMKQYQENNGPLHNKYVIGFQSKFKEEFCKLNKFLVTDKHITHTVCKSIFSNKEKAEKYKEFYEKILKGTLEIKFYK